jgi:competence ComEA-like helix-hairpin-helix protein
MMMLAPAFLYVAVLPAQTPGTASSKTSGKTQSQVQEKTPALKGKTININKATAEDLVKNVPLITPELAKKIVQYRKDNGDFQSLDELLQIEGFSKGLYERIKKFFMLEGVGGKDCTC